MHNEHNNEIKFNCSQKSEFMALCKKYNTTATKVLNNFIKHHLKLYKLFRG